MDKVEKLKEELEQADTLEEKLAIKDEIRKAEGKEPGTCEGCVCESCSG